MRVDSASARKGFAASSGARPWKAGLRTLNDMARASVLIFWHAHKGKLL